MFSIDLNSLFFLSLHLLRVDGSKEWHLYSQGQLGGVLGILYRYLYVCDLGDMRQLLGFNGILVKNGVLELGISLAHSNSIINLSGGVEICFVYGFK